MRTLIQVCLMIVVPVALADADTWAAPGQSDMIAVSLPDEFVPSNDNRWETCRSLPTPEAIASCTDILQRGALLRTYELANVYFYRGRAFFHRGETSAAIADLDRAISLSPMMGVAYMYRGSALAIRGEFDAAISDFTTAISILPYDPQVHLDRGRVYLAKGNIERASADVNRAIELDPRSAPALAMRGIILEVQGHPHEALAAFEAALAIDPDLPIALRGHSRLAPATN